MKRNKKLETELTGIVLNEVKYGRWLWLSTEYATSGKTPEISNVCRDAWPRVADAKHMQAIQLSALIANSSTLPFVIVRCLNGYEHISNVFWGCIELPGDFLVVQGHRMPRTHFASSVTKICYRECRLDEERARNSERNAK